MNNVLRFLTIWYYHGEKQFKWYFILLLGIVICGSVIFQFLNFIGTKDELGLGQGMVDPLIPFNFMLVEALGLSFASFSFIELSQSHYAPHRLLSLPYSKAKLFVYRIVFMLIAASLAYAVLSALVMGICMAFLSFFDLQPLWEFNSLGLIQLFPAFILLLLTMCTFSLYPLALRLTVMLPLNLLAMAAVAILILRLYVITDFQLFEFSKELSTWFLYNYLALMAMTNVLMGWRYFNQLEDSLS